MVAADTADGIAVVRIAAVVDMLAEAVHGIVAEAVHSMAVVAAAAHSAVAQALLPVFRSLCKTYRRLIIVFDSLSKSFLYYPFGKYLQNLRNGL